MKKSVLASFLAIVLLICSCSGSGLSEDVAMTIGGEEIDVVEFEYQYNDSIATFYEQNYDLIPYLGIDFSKDLSQQSVSETQTWRDYFIEAAVQAMKEQKTLILAGREAGFEMSEEQKKSVEDSFGTLYAEVAQYGYDLNEYLTSNYGENITVEKFEEYIMNNAYAFYYRQKLLLDVPVSDEALSDYYEANKKNIENVDFLVYSYGYTVPEGVEEGDESYKTEAKTSAEAALANINSVEEFEPYIKSTLSDDALASWVDGYTKATATYSKIFTELADWLYDAQRVEGDKTILEYNNYFFVVMFVDRYVDEYRPVDVRHCLVKTETVKNVLIEGTEDVDVEATQAAQEASDAEAYAEAEKLLNDWVATGAKEEDFAIMADANSDDGAVGGLYQDVLKGQMVTAFEDWCFDENRKVGDYGIVKTPYGYHIMYFSAVSEDSYWVMNAKASIQQEAYAEIFEEFSSNYKIVKNENAITKIR